MRPDKLIMLGVGALGAYAVYRMLKTDAKAPQTSTDSSTLPAGPRLDPRQVLSNPNTLLLKSQTQYRMRLELEEGLPPLSASSSDAEVSGALKQLGFADAQVFRTPPSWFQVDATQNPGVGTRFVVAQWGPTTMSVERPKAIALIWQTKIPGT